MSEKLRKGDSVTIVHGRNKGNKGTVIDVTDKYVEVRYGNSRVTLDKDDVVITDMNSYKDFVTVSGNEFRKSRITDKGYAISRVFERAGLTFGGADKIFNEKLMSKSNYNKFKKALDEIDALPEEEKKYYLKKKAGSQKQIAVPVKESVNQSVNKEFKPIKADKKEKTKNEPVQGVASSCEVKEEVKEMEQEQEKEIATEEREDAAQIDDKEGLKILNKKLKSSLGLVKWLQLMQIANEDLGEIENVFER